jgi:hypothetical protein
LTLVAVPVPGQPLKTFGGPIDVRVEVDTGLEGATFGVWNTGLWDTATWGADDAQWFDITDYVLKVDIAGGAERWGERFRAGSCSIVVDNDSGIFTPESGVPNPWHLPFRPGRRIRVVAIPDPTAPLTKAPLFTGEIEVSDDDYQGAGFAVRATIACTDYMGTWADHNPAALTVATGLQLTSARVGAALDRLSWPSADRDIQTGVHTMLSSFLAQTTLEEAARAADAEGGAFFAGPEGKAYFKARDWLITDSRSVTVQGYLGYETVPAGAQSAHLLNVDTSWERAEIANQVHLARTGGAVQTVSDATSIDENGTRSYQRMDFELSTDAQVLTLANRYLARHKDLHLRIVGATIAANEDVDNEDLNRLFWDIRYGDRLAVRIAPAVSGGWEIEREVQVFGIAHSISADDWVVALKLDDALEA